eukprot:GHVL01007315.1.p1 GENE.GHVL01007315.1~~GHVL01007315.1.p1  ORF type:complete len:181 (+),score=26.64 GHVL01007315.1:440-982(+)
MDVCPEMPKFVFTALVNMGLCIRKDKIFAQIFGTSSAHSLPTLSYIFFIIRDSMTIAASFNLPKIVSSYLSSSSTTSDKVSFLPMKSSISLPLSQFFCPLAAQLISTPLHLASLDLYNRPSASVQDRSKLIARLYPASAGARMLRMAPAFGFGGIGNSFLRHRIAKFVKLEEDHSSPVNL